MMRDAGLRQRGHLLLWAPVALGCGIGLYFEAGREPSVAALAGSALVGLILLPVSRLIPEAARPLLWGLTLIALGFALAGTRARAVAEPVLGFRYYGPVEGRIVRIDKSASDALRLTLDRVVLSMEPARTPARIRIALHGAQEWITPEPGQVVILTAHLGPPGGPVEPGGFDFQRHAWFKQLGAVGYTRTPVLLLDHADPPGVERLRHAISHAVAERIGGAPGAFAAAVTAGDRSALDQADVEALRRSNLAHLLAISGLHMGLMTGVVFFALRAVGAAIAPLALRLPLRKIAAVGAMAAGALYLALSGGAVATERAFIMAMVVLGAVLLDRRALTLRAVAVAALIVLVLRPEALTGPGFQMSFAATTALILIFRALQRHRWARHPVLSVLISSLVAGLATAPFAAAHFNQIAHFGLLANIVSVPVMAMVVMPSAVLAAVLWPFGLAGIGLWAMEWGLRWILWVARTVSDLPGAVSHVPAPSGSVLPLLAFGALWSCLWQGRARIAGAVPVLAAFVIWGQGTRPDLLIAQTGGLVGVMTDQGRSLSRPRGDGFAAQLWLENDGAPVEQETAAERPAWSWDGRIGRATMSGLTVLSVRGKTALGDLVGCGGADILITNSLAGERPCLIFDPPRLQETGAVAISVGADGVRIETAKARAGSRLWNTPQPPASAPDQ
ncbi:MAG: competence protein [Rhodobacterales bacterium]|nr:MAG: competence protein [Rhodobacterales bacterium]